MIEHIIGMLKKYRIMNDDRAYHRYVKEIQDNE